MHKLRKNVADEAVAFVYSLIKAILYADTEILY